MEKSFQFRIEQIFDNLVGVIGQLLVQLGLGSHLELAADFGVMVLAVAPEITPVDAGVVILVTGQCALSQSWHFGFTLVATRLLVLAVAIPLIHDLSLHQVTLLVVERRTAIPGVGRQRRTHLLSLLLILRMRDIHTPLHSLAARVLLVLLQSVQVVRRSSVVRTWVFTHGAIVHTVWLILVSRLRFASLFLERIH